MVDTFLDGHDELYHHVKLQVKLRRTDGHLVRLAVQNFTSIGAAGCECGPKISKISTFGKESPHRGDSLDRFRNFIGAFLWARRALSPCKVWGRSHNVRKCGVCFLVFFLSRSEFGAPCVRGAHSSKPHCVAVYCPISTRFSPFFRKDCSLRCAT